MENFVLLAGNVGADPDIRNTRSGSKVANFRVATSRPKRDSEGRILKDEKTGYRIEDTEWHRITAFNGLAESVAKGVKKGMKLVVRGRIHNTEWADATTGEKRYGYEIIAEDITFLTRPAKQAAADQAPPARDPEDDDDVPF